MVWQYRSPIPSGRRGVISSFKWFLPDIGTLCAILPPCCLIKLLPLAPPLIHCLLPHNSGFCNTCTLKQMRLVMLLFHNCSITKQDCYKTTALFIISDKKKLAAILGKVSSSGCNVKHIHKIIQKRLHHLQIQALLLMLTKWNIKLWVQEAKKSRLEYFFLIFARVYIKKICLVLCTLSHVLCFVIHWNEMHRFTVPSLHDPPLRSSTPITIIITLEILSSK